MHLDYMRSFCKVVKVKSITKAATLLHLSQPALSLQINCLESRFGVKLLERTNRGVKVTPAGDMVYRHGLRMLKMLQTLENSLTEMQVSTDLEITICASHVPGNYILPANIVEFSKSYPQRKISILIQTLPEIIQELQDHTAHIGIIEGPIPQSLLSTLKDEKIQVKQGGQDRIVPVCHANSRWKNHKDTQGVPLILPPKESGIRSSLGEIGHPFLELELPGIITALQADSGIALIPSLAIKNNPDLIALDIKHLTFQLPITYLYPMDLEKDPSFKAILDFWLKKSLPIK